MTDINKLIEEYTIDDFERMAMETDYAVEANEDTCKINEADAGAFYKEGFKAGASFILHLNRWRKVEEEMPEVKDLQYFILAKCKTEFRIICISIICPDVSYQMNYFCVIEWKPII